MDARGFGSLKNEQKSRRLSRRHRVRGPRASSTHRGRDFLSFRLFFLPPTPLPFSPPPPSLLADFTPLSLSLEATDPRVFPQLLIPRTLSNTGRIEPIPRPAVTAPQMGREIMPYRDPPGAILGKQRNGELPAIEFAESSTSRLSSRQKLVGRVAAGSGAV